MNDKDKNKYIDDLSNEDTYETESYNGVDFDSDGRNTIKVNQTSYRSTHEHNNSACDDNHADYSNPSHKGFDDEQFDDNDEEYDDEYDEEYDDEYNEMNESNNRKKKIRTFNIVLYCIAAILILGGIGIILSESILISHDETEGLVSEEDYYKDKDIPKETYKPLSTPISDYEIVPVKFHFIDVNVNGERKSVSCDIYATGIGESGGMETVNTAEDASWLSESPYVVPGDIGNAVIAGHNLWKGKAGTFKLIKDLHIGDCVAVTFDRGFTRYFEVYKVDECKYNDTSIMKSDYDEPVLTLITCKGDWSDELQQSKTRVYALCRPVSHN